MSVVAFLQRVLSVLDPTIAVLVCLKFNVLGNEGTTCDRYGLVPCLVVDLSEGV